MHWMKERKKFPNPNSKIPHAQRFNLTTDKPGQNRQTFFHLFFKVGFTDNVNLPSKNQQCIKV